MIHFVGAGSGAPDLITVRGQRFLREADVVIYAGSLVNPELLKETKPGCEIHDSAKMTLEEVIAVIRQAEAEGKTTVRLHTGDSSIYGTVREQFDALEKLGILPDAVESAGKAALLLDRLNKRRDEGLTTPKQIRCLEKYGFQHVGTWSFEAARHMIDRIAAQGWRGVPKGVNPRTYTPAAEPPAADSPFDFGW